MPEERKIHQFEAAGLGKAPYTPIGVKDEVIRYPDGTVQPAGACQYCSTGIRYCFYLRSADGKVFYVGSECILKSGDAGLKKYVTEEQRKLRDAQAQERYTAAVAVIKEAMQKHGQDMRGSSHPIRPDLNLYDYCEFMLQHGGRSGAESLARRLRRQFGDLETHLATAKRSAMPRKRRGEAPGPRIAVTRALVPVGPVFDTPPRVLAAPAPVRPPQEKPQSTKWEAKDLTRWLRDYCLIYALKQKNLGRTRSGFKLSFIPSVMEQFETKGYLSDKQTSIIWDMLTKEDERNNWLMRVFLGLDEKKDAIDLGYLTAADLLGPMSAVEHREALDKAWKLAQLEGRIPQVLAGEAEAVRPDIQYVGTYIPKYRRMQPTAPRLTR